MNEIDIRNEEEAIAPAMTDEEAAALEAARTAEYEAKIEPLRAAAKQRKESAAIVAEHDDMLADILFEMTMNEMED